ncbi:hypothetical protein G5714_023670 [Onychostoma macrolepis]|uniref:Uncharacterized protein n=1 Tax=Onychostoma macrolepis TaxID=369639 RepID=A0A7J6BLX1_9TELE|nr:hypothetical protein G5714_023670 [Onychostoma macrolepis]
MLPFAIVDFLDGGGVAVVPCKWFTGPEEDACYWPPGRVNISKAVKDEVVPNSDWPQFKVRILGKAGNYAHATAKLLKSEVTSDLQTESDSGGNMGKGKRKRRPVSLSSSDEESDGAGHDRPPSSVPLLPPVQRSANQRLLSCSTSVHLSSPLHLQHLQLLHQTADFSKEPIILHLGMAFLYAFYPSWRKLRRCRGFMER